MDVARDVMVEREGDGWLWSALVMQGFAERLRGRRGRPRTWPTTVFPRCRSVHTVGMDHELDVAFVDGEGQVLEVARGVGPHRLLTRPEADWVMERAAAQDRWVTEGDRVRLRGMEDGDGWDR